MEAAEQKNRVKNQNQKTETIRQNKPNSNVQGLAFAPPESTTTSLLSQMKTAQAGIQQLAFAPPEQEEEKTVQKKSNSNGLPFEVQAKMENTMGHDFSNVNIYKDSKNATDAGALAYAQGNDVHFAPGQFKPDTTSGQELIGHELAHVVQQREGRVKPTKVLGKGLAVNDDVGLEKEADEMGKKAAQAKFSESPILAQKTTSTATPIQYFRQPIVAQAPQEAMGISDFITLVEQEERKYPEETQKNTSHMISVLRKIFYNSDGWNNKLILGTNDIQSPYGEPKERERERTEVEILGSNFDMVETETYPVVDQNSDERPEIYNNQEIAIEGGNHDGIYLDIGHIFAGLDAFNHRGNVSAPVLGAISLDNVEGTTWVGDLGSVLAEVQTAWINKGNALETQELQSIVSEYASPQDMIGNIDAYAIAMSYDVDSNNGQKVSEILKHFYLGEGLSQNQSRRYHLFAEGIGLTGWNGTTWNNEEERIVHYIDQVNDAAALYIGSRADKNLLNIAGVSGAILGMSGNQGARSFVEAFFNSLKTCMQTER